MKILKTTEAGSILKQLDMIGQEFCMNYCKFNHFENSKAMDDTDFEKFLDDICSKCPVTKYLIE